MSSPRTNLFLESLSPEGRDRLISRSTAVELPVRTTLYAAEVTPEFAYFIMSGIASVVTAMDDGRTAEVGVIGREGIVGSMHLLGPAVVSTDCFIQMTATGLRIRLSDLRNAFRAAEEIRDRTLELIQEQALSLGQLAACNRLHEQEERLARWLLMMQDRTQTEVLDITQEFLAQMLGAKRTTVTVVAGALQRAGLIEYQRGKITILDRLGLESSACVCYGIVKSLYSNLYSRPYSPSRASLANDELSRSRSELHLRQPLDRPLA